MYDRMKAVSYARKWALRRNPQYYDFELLGGDCTNYISQCLYAGYGEMNYAKPMGWYYRSLKDRAPAWTGVEYLYNFLISNRGSGPKGVNIDRSQLMMGDLVQLSNGMRYHHTLIVSATLPKILICAHSFDALDEPLDGYEYKLMRCLRIS